MGKRGRRRTMTTRNSTSGRQASARVTPTSPPTAPRPSTATPRTSPPLRPLSPTVRAIRDETERRLGHPVNHVLLQLYRGGADYISEHSDKTLDIVPGSYIANVSLGAERTMVLRTKRRPRDAGTGAGAGAGDPPRALEPARLPHNSLCLQCALDLHDALRRHAPAGAELSAVPRPLRARLAAWDAALADSGSAFAADFALWPVLYAMARRWPGAAFGRARWPAALLRRLRGARLRAQGARAGRRARRERMIDETSAVPWIGCFPGLAAWSTLSMSNSTAACRVHVLKKHSQHHEPT